MENNYNDIRQVTNVDLLAKTPVLNRPVLRLGDQNEYVSLLQTQLKKLTFYGGDIDGNFDNDTLLSVMAFQNNNKLSADGIVGKDTWSALIYLYSSLEICSTKIYIVQAGDTLWSIARRFDTTVDEIKRLNNLTSNLLSVGQKLIISGEEEVVEPEENIVHTVEKGDTLWSIANKYNTTVDEIKRLNNLTSNILSIGQKLKIKGEEEVIIEPEENIVHTVVKGDTLWSIANKYNTTVNEIKRLNNLTSNILSIGQKLIIKGKAEIPIENNITYTVQKGDTLWSIANKYNTTVNEIKTLNNLTSNILSIGQILKIKTI